MAYFLQFNSLSMGRLVYFFILILFSLNSGARVTLNPITECSKILEEVSQQCHVFSPYNGQDPDSMVRDMIALQINQQAMKDMVAELDYSQEFGVVARGCNQDYGNEIVRIHFLPYNHQNKQQCVTWQFKDNHGRKQVVEQFFVKSEIFRETTFTQAQFDERMNDLNVHLTGERYGFPYSIGKRVPDFSGGLFWVNEKVSGFFGEGGSGK